MPEFYYAALDEFKKELERSATEVFLHPLPFTQVNRLAMIAATVAERCATELPLPDAGVSTGCQLPVGNTIKRIVKALLRLPIALFGLILYPLDADLADDLREWAGFDW